jgi:hypothetical protein
MPGASNNRGSSAPTEAFDWQPFIGRCLALLALGAADMSDKPVLERAEYLMRLGLPRREAAMVLGSTDESLRVMLAAKAKKDTSTKKAKA